MADDVPEMAIESTTTEQDTNDEIPQPDEQAELCERCRDIDWDDLLRASHRVTVWICTNLEKHCVFQGHVICAISSIVLWAGKKKARKITELFVTTAFLCYVLIKQVRRYVSCGSKPLPNSVRVFIWLCLYFNNQAN